MTDSAKVALPANLALAENITVEGACDHDWRVNPVIVATTPTGNYELWMCAKCKAQRTGPRLPVQSNRLVHPFDPTTWEHRAAS